MSGAVYALGRHDYGRLGLGEDCTEINVPTVIPGLHNITSIDAGTAVSFCVDNKGKQECRWVVGGGRCA